MSNALLRPSGEILPRPRKSELRLWLLGALAGLLGGLAIVMLRSLVTYAEFAFFDAVGPRLATRLPELSWVRRLFAPIIGGIIIAALLRLGVSFGWGVTPRPYGFTDVIANRRLRGNLKTTTFALRDAFLSAIASVISIGAGGSGGREGPAIHLGASVSLFPGRLLGLDIATRRLLLGMGVAAGLAAALQTPLAAVLFAREVLLPQHRLTALGPVAVASVTSWAVARSLLGDAPVLAIPEVGAAPLPFIAAALILTPVFAVLAWSSLYFWTKSAAVVLNQAERRHVPVWTLPILGGVLLGLFCIAFPLVMGVGYTPVSNGLGGYYRADLMLVLAVAKVAAAAITFAFRFGGGPIAPMIYVGAMMGSVAGAIVGLAMGEPSIGQVYFGLIGMGVALTVLLEAPLFAAVLVLELSSSPEAAAATLACACLALYLLRRFAPPMPEPGDALRSLKWR